MNKKAGIYKILNKSNDKIYIGSAINLSRRWVEHRSCLRKNKHRNQYLQNAWNKYGEINFEFVVIETIESATKEKLENREQYWLDFHKSYENGYNILLKADFTRTGTKHTEETKKKISEAQKYIIHPNPIWLQDLSPETKEEIRLSRLGENSRSNLTNQQVLEIKKRIFGGENPRLIGLAYGVSRSTISAIKNEKTWKHIIYEPEEIKIFQYNQGSTNGSAKLNEEKVIEIKKGIVAGKTMRSLAESYGVSYDTITAIKYGETWNHVKIDENINHAKVRCLTTAKKLTEEDVILIKQMIFNGKTNVEIAHKFEVAHQTISYIRLNKIWKHVPWPK